ncbi:hypothetical protein NCS57_00683100 [Fusarium keratoplasticum]|uniref:Uncharacterized protein n=1 Tax=Fusarium keratoplasticum TaxID=1328300 RepID=A0ACC0QUQ6_9HYPO|nr:hypothetical protein NCS57_00683100 [Fusarium keratoplasticum]KAI8668709.1 hypothetical protein NCS57_00683100 [Fusarium keratoplasticum]KAI8673317.1 hypothetical protein NCS55_00651000 [Fusarium keratoplasticum]
MSKSAVNTGNTRPAACCCWYCTKRTPDHQRDTTEKTSISGRRVDPAKLENLLNKLFADQYAVSMRDNSYTIWASRKLDESETQQCY